VKDRNCLENLDVFERVILKWTLSKMEGFELNSCESEWEILGAISE
jgi:hypothetical protein